MKHLISFLLMSWGLGSLCDEEGQSGQPFFDPFNVIHTSAEEDLSIRSREDVSTQEPADQSADPISADLVVSYTVIDQIRYLVAPPIQTIGRDLVRSIMTKELGMKLDANQKRVKDQMVALLEEKREFVMSRLADPTVVSLIRAKLDDERARATAKSRLRADKP